MGRKGGGKNRGGKGRKNKKGGGAGRSKHQVVDNRAIGKELRRIFCETAGSLPVSGLEICLQMPGAKKFFFEVKAAQIAEKKEVNFDGLLVQVQVSKEVTYFALLEIAFVNLCRAGVYTDDLIAHRQALHLLQVWCSKPYGKHSERPLLDEVRKFDESHPGCLAGYTLPERKRVDKPKPKPKPKGKSKPKPTAGSEPASAPAHDARSAGTVSSVPAAAAAASAASGSEDSDSEESEAEGDHDVAVAGAGTGGRKPGPASVGVPKPAVVPLKSTADTAPGDGGAGAWIPARGRKRRGAAAGSGKDKHKDEDKDKDKTGAVVVVHRPAVHPQQYKLVEAVGYPAGAEAVLGRPVPPDIKDSTAFPCLPGTAPAPAAAPGLKPGPVAAPPPASVPTATTPVVTTPVTSAPVAPAAPPAGSVASTSTTLREPSSTGNADSSAASIVSTTSDSGPSSAPSSVSAVSAGVAPLLPPPLPPVVWTYLNFRAMASLPVMCHSEFLYCFACLELTDRDYVNVFPLQTDVQNVVSAGKVQYICGDKTAGVSYYEPSMGFFEGVPHRSTLNAQYEVVMAIPRKRGKKQAVDLSAVTAWLVLLSSNGAWQAQFLVAMQLQGPLYFEDWSLGDTVRVESTGEVRLPSMRR